MLFYYSLLAIWFYYFLREHCRVRKSELVIIAYGILTVFSTFFNGFFIADQQFVQVLWRPIRIFLSILIGYHFYFCTTTLTRKKFYWILYLLILISIAYGFYQKTAGIGWGYNSRMDSFFGHPITYGSILIFGVWLTVYLIKSFPVKLILLFYITLGLISTGSRSAWLSLVATIIPRVVLGLKAGTLKKRQVFIILICIVLSIAFVFTKQFQNIYTSIFSRFSGMMNTASATQRLGSYYYIISELLAQNPVRILFGCGENASTRIMMKTVITLSLFGTTDCQYLTILYNYGFIGLGMAIFFFGSIFKRACVLSSNGEAKFIVLSLLGVLCSAFFYDFYGWLSISTLFMLFSGIYLGLRASGNVH